MVIPKNRKETEHMEAFKRLLELLAGLGTGAGILLAILNL